MKRRLAVVFLLVIGLVGLAAGLGGEREAVAQGGGGLTFRASVRSDGSQLNGFSESPGISANGRYVAFRSVASNIVANDTNGVADIFVHDILTAETFRVSVSNTGEQANDESEGWADLSADGRFVVFDSPASNLVANDNQMCSHRNCDDIFVRDRETNQTFLVSRHTNGTPGNEGSFQPAISDDGRYIVFYSYASNLIDGDTNGAYDVFRHDLQTHETTIVSRPPGGAQSDAISEHPSLSGDGRFVAFQSRASNLVPNDTNSYSDIFVRDMQTGAIQRISTTVDGYEVFGESQFPDISGDGRFIIFVSEAPYLVPEDTNRQPDVFIKVYS